MVGNRLELEILCYALRNSPLRMVPVSRLSMDRPNGRALQSPLQLLKSPLAVSLDDVPNQVPELRLERLQDMADDQLLFFWAESARFVVSGPTKKWTRRVSESKTSERIYTRYHRIISDCGGNQIGHTVDCNGISDDEEAESGVCEFILLANHRPPTDRHQRVTMQIKRRDGIAYRVNIADIQPDAWSGAELTRTLIALG